MESKSLYKNKDAGPALKTLITLDGVKRFKSVFRAINRGLVSPFGVIYPNRPFNNRKPTRGRKLNEEKKHIYEQFKLNRGL